MTELALRMCRPPHRIEPTGVTTVRELMVQSGVRSTHTFGTIIWGDSIL